MGSQSNGPVNNQNNAFAIGSSFTDVFITIFETRDPTPYDNNYPVKKRWLNTTPGSISEFILVNYTNVSGETLANWLNIDLNNLNSFNQIVIRSFTSSGTYTPTTGMTYCIVESVGGGGGGGGAASTGGATVSAAGGGGSGGYSRSVFTAATIGASQTVTIGAGGATGTNLGGNGGTGGNTSLGALISATGGSGGTGSIAGSIAINPGGSGGNAVGTVSAFGNFGFAGWASTTLSIVSGGNGAGSYFGGGSAGSTGGSGGAGGNGQAYGAAGGGAAQGNTQPGAIGGLGIAGVVIITEYLSI